MKTNLDSIFKAAESMEKDGIWFDINETTAFLMRRYSPSNPPVRAMMAKMMKPYTRQIQNGTMDPKKDFEINVKIFVACALIDWKGVEIEGDDTPFSAEVAVKLFLSLPDLYNVLTGYASDLANYREDLGNSSALT